MFIMSTVLEQPPDKKVILAKAILNAAVQLDLKSAQLARILYVHHTAINQLKRNPVLNPASQQGERALLLLRIYSVLYALTGGDMDWMRHFMNTSNALTGGVPAEQLESINGLHTVLQYVEGIQNKI